MDFFVFFCKHDTAATRGQYLALSKACVDCVCLCVEKDVARTDRTHAFFHGDNNPNIAVLYDILLTHCMYNFDLGQSSVCLSVCL